MNGPRTRRGTELIEAPRKSDQAGRTSLEKEDLSRLFVASRSTQAEMESAAEEFLKPIPEELLICVFNRLNSRQLAVVACTCKGWRSAASTLNSSAHWYRSAMARNFYSRNAMDELLDDVLGAPFWPDFAIIFAGEEVDLNEVSEVMKMRLPKDLPLIACNTTGMMGRDLDSEVHVENSHSSDDEEGNWDSLALVLSVGRFPGVHVKALKLRNSLADAEVKRFVASASTAFPRGRPGQPPLAILLLAIDHLEDCGFSLFSGSTTGLQDTSAEFTQPLKELDKAYGGKSAIGGGVVGLMGKKKCLLVHSSPAQMVQRNDGSSTKRSRLMDLEETCLGNTSCDLVGLVFSEDFRSSKKDMLLAGSLKCAVASSGILKAVGPLYKVISSRVSSGGDTVSTSVTCERDGELMTAEDVAEEVVYQNHLQEPGDLTHIGIFRPRSKQNRAHFSLHEVLGTSDVLTISDVGVRTRDCFRFYTPCIDGNVAVESMSNAVSSLGLADEVKAKNPFCSAKQRRRRRSIIGGLLFSGEYFWNHVFFRFCEIADFHDVLPDDVPMAGLTCHCQFGPPAVLPGGTDVERESTQGQVMGNFFSTTCFLFFTE